MRQYYTFNNSSILPSFFLGSVSVVYIILSLALRFFNFYTIAITRLLNVIIRMIDQYSFVLEMIEYTYTNKYTIQSFKLTSFILPKFLK